MILVLWVIAVALIVCVALLAMLLRERLLSERALAVQLSALTEILTGSLNRFEERLKKLEGGK
jgi:hypothetical protein